MSKTCPDRHTGFVLPAAIFLLVVLAALGGYILSVSTAQHSGQALDVVGSRALQVARFGIEWGAFQARNMGSVSTYCPTTATPAAPSVHTLPQGTLTGLADFSVRVECYSKDVTEGSATLRLYRLAVIACNAATCGTPTGPNYVERKLYATVTE